MANMQTLENVKEHVDCVNEHNIKDCIASTCIPITVLTLSKSFGNGIFTILENLNQNKEQ